MQAHRESCRGSGELTGEVMERKRDGDVTPGRDSSWVRQYFLSEKLLGLSDWQRVVAIASVGSLTEIHLLPSPLLF